jgi:hypothetical protein
VPADDVKDDAPVVGRARLLIRTAIDHEGLTLPAMNKNIHWM